jgi:apolipoprotein N-acyltransferase
MWLHVVAAALSGGLLCLSDHPVNAWPLSAVALVPFLAVLAAKPAPLRTVAWAALAFAVTYTTPLSVVLRFPLYIAVGQAVIFASLFVVVWLGVARALTLGPIAGPLAAGAWAALIEWANVELVPLWGTAQSFVRVWSAWPPAMQSTALWGMTGLVFVLFATQALLVTLVREERARLRAAIAFAAVLALPAFAAVRPTRTELPPVRVAAIGWASPTVPEDSRRILEEVIAPRVAEAARRGARLVVTPEVGITVTARDKSALLGRVSALAREHAVVLALGYFDAADDKNRIAFFSEQGVPLREYEKTHLISFLEHYQAGSGAIVSVQSPLLPVNVGGLICQDDNFTDLARGHGRAGNGIVVVPTNDWREVAPFHFNNSRFRPVENGYALVRAASNGYSAIVSPRGQVVAFASAFEEGPVLLVAEVTPGSGGTLYARAGGLVPLLWLAILAAAVFASRRRSGAA